MLKSLALRAVDLERFDCATTILSPLAHGAATIGVLRSSRRSRNCTSAIGRRCPIIRNPPTCMIDQQGYLT